MIARLTIGRIEKRDRKGGKKLKETASFEMRRLVLAPQLVVTFTERFLRNDGNYGFSLALFFVSILLR